MTEDALPKEFASRMRAQLGDEYPRYLAALAETPARSLRVNTRKVTAERFIDLLGFQPKPNGMLPEGFLMPEGFSPARDPLHRAGLYYMQEPSAQAPVPMLNVQPGDAVLDLCAAPGGKAGQIAAALSGTGVLVANEIIPERASVLLENLVRLGVTNAVVTNMQPDALCQRLTGCFDRVLVDAPCSGEGMFRREPAAVAAWSAEHVLSCAARQKLILESAAKALRGGGTLVYSTCTFSEEENEGVVQHFLQAHPEFSLEGMRRLYPHTSAGEGQFMARLQKCDTGRARLVSVKPEPCSAFTAFCGEQLASVPAGAVRVLPDGRVLLLPEKLPLCWERLRIRRAGVLAGEVRGGRLMPDHALFLALPASAFLQRVPLGGELLARYLAGETVPVRAGLRGYAAVTVSGYPIGFGKAGGGTLKNHYPKALRVQR